MNKTLKRCPKCKETKGRKRFWKNVTRKDGLNVWCIDCLKIGVNKNKRRESSRRHIQKNKHKQLARQKLHKAKIAGVIMQETCFLCGKYPTDAHHINYRYPLKVIWLCKKHHSDLHNEL